MSTIAVNIWLLNYFLGFYEFSLISLGKTLYMVFFVGIVPYIMVTFVRHIYLMRKRLNEAIRINKKLLAKKNKLVDAVRLLNCRGLLNKIELSDFYYAESKGNDLHIFCIMEGELIEYQIRCTISSFVEDNADNPSVFRCHRSFVINIDKVLRIQGNAANYQVLLSKQLRFITVSRSYVAAFKATLVREELHD
jgi:DNA-binding LytR/AlgR family response regulator